MNETAQETAQFRGNWIDWLSVLCKTELSTVEEFYACVDTKLREKDELVLRMQDFSFATTIMTNRTGHWEDFVENLWNGRCQTMRDFGTLEENLYLKVFLNKSFPYQFQIFLHDPNFFILSVNPTQTPFIEINLDVKGNDKTAFQYIKAEKHILLNREEEPCQDYDKIESSFRVHSQ